MSPRMGRPGRWILSGAGLFMALATAHAEDTHIDADLRCMAVMAKINQLPDQRHQIESLIGGYYYLGRLQAAAPELDLGQKTAAAYAKMSPAEFLSETGRCEQEMRTNGHAISEIGGAMPKMPQSASPPPEEQK
jgi:hypothetical protein